MNWRTHATPDELARIEELKERRADASAEIKQIYERCRKRISRAERKVNRKNGENGDAKGAEI